MEIPHPYHLFLGDVADRLGAKTGIGIVDWRREWCLGQLRLPGCKADAGISDMTVAEARAAGAKTFVIGCVNSGGSLPEHWVDTIIEAIESGMNVASGLHIRLSAVPGLADAARKAGVELFDVRHSSERFGTGTGAKRPGKRLLTVGTDCSVGKKYTVLALEKGMRDRGFDADFRATGQTGVFISGRGVSIDAVVADFISGAAEYLSPAADENHWDLVEGQGSLFHPAFAGVSMGLLHGSQPDAFVVCHEPTRTTMRAVQTPLPSVQQVIDLTILAGKVTNPDIRCVGISINTSALDDDEAKEFLARISADYDLPATDPVRYGVEVLVDRIETEFGKP